MSIKKRVLEASIPSVSAKLETITPDMAKKYLASNPRNRNVRPKRVKAIAQDIRNKNWQTNGEPIVFDENGALKDGQHRLHGIIESGIPVEMLVVRGISSEVSIFDRGSVRSTTDTLRMEGFPANVSGTEIVALVKLHYSMANSNATYISDSAVGNFIDKYEDDLAFISTLGSKKKMTGSQVSTRTAPILLACFYAVRAGVDREKIGQFLKVVKTGEYDGAAQSAAIRLRNDILDRKIDTNKGGAERKIAEPCVEKALYDFVHRTPRRMSYAGHGDGIYFKLFMKSEDVKK